MADNDNFAKGDYVVYPAHGVGMIEGVETQEISGMEIKLYAISFEKDRMRLKIPMMKAKESGLRKLCTTTRLKDALKTLKGKARVRRTMWSRRAQEYETKINSGDPIGKRHDAFKSSISFIEAIRFTKARLTLSPFLFPKNF